MPMLVDGKWIVEGDRVRDADGRFLRPVTQFRNWVTPDGAPGPTGDGGFKAEPGRYHLYVSLACPWAHRTIIFRKLKGLEGIISMSVVHWFWGRDGWTFSPGPRVTTDPLFGVERLYEIYVRAKSDFTGRVTVPVLFDRKTGTIVSNESAEIIRMMNSAFDGVGAKPGDYYPPALRSEIDVLNARVYETLNNGVYRAGFASTQKAYEEGARGVFATLDALEARLKDRAFLFGESQTEADWRLFTTLVRFDAVYFSLFKCNLRSIAAYPALSAYMERLARTPGVGETIDFQHIKGHYWESLTTLNPSGIVPIGPVPPAWAAEVAKESKAA
jgi:glutathionyl-hydroquinone reductase